MPKEERQIKEITDNDLDTGRDLVTENYELEILTLKDKVDLRRFSRAFLKVDKLLKSIFTGKEDKFPKNSGFNRVKTDLAENDTNKVFSAKGAFDLKTYLITNYTTLMNNIRDTLTNSINTKLPHGGYNQSAQTLKNEIDTKLPRSGGSMYGELTFSEQDKGIRFSRVNSGTTPTHREGGDFLTAGCDYAGLEKINNIAIQSWYGFSVSSTYGSGSVPIGQCAFSIDARSGNSYAFGNLYAEKNKRVYHEGYKPSANDVGAVSKSGDTMTGNLSIKTNNYPSLHLDNTANGYNRALRIEHSQGNLLRFIKYTDISASALDKYLNWDMTASGTIYHTGNKPSAGEIGALNKSGDLIGGALRFNASNRLTADYTSGSGVLGTASGAGIRGGFDTASLLHTGNIDIYSWNGITFSSAYGGIETPRFLMDTRNSAFYAKGNIFAYQDQAVITDIRLSGYTRVTTWDKAIDTYASGRVQTGSWKDNTGPNLDGVSYATLQKKANNTWYTVATS